MRLLKEDTEYVIDELRDGGCRCVMVTGDHVRTAIHIARSSGMIHRHFQPQEPLLILGDVDRLTKTVVWTDLETDTVLSQQQVEKFIAASQLAENRDCMKCIHLHMKMHITDII